MNHQGDDPNAPRERQQGPGQPRQPQQQPPQQPSPPQGGQQGTQPPQQSGQQPPATRRQSGQQGSMGGGQQPMRGGQQPPMSSGQQQQPMGGQQQQSMGGQQPMRGSQQPPMSSGQQQPMGGQQQQSMGGGQQQQPMGGQPSGVQGGASMGIQGPQQPIQPRGERSTALQPMTINEVMSSDVVTCETDTPITTIVGKMAEEDVGMIVVVEGESPVNVITDRAIALALQENPDIADGTAEDLMTEGDVVTGSSEMTIVEALGKMSSENIRRLPIVDDDGNLEGVLSLDDVLIVFGKGLGDVADLIADQVKR